MLLTNQKLRSLKPTNERQVIRVQERSGLSLIVEALPTRSIRFEGRMKFPFSRSGRTRYVPIGVYKKDIQKVEDALTKWTEIKAWSKENNSCPTLFKHKDQTPKKDITLAQVSEEFLDYYSKTRKKRSSRDRKNKLNQILNFFGEDTSISEFEKSAGGRQKVIAMVRHIEKGVRHKPSFDQAARCRGLLQQVFKFAIDRDYLHTNTAGKLIDERVGHIKKGNPHIKWSDVSYFLRSVSENSCNGGLLVDYALKAHLLMCSRVGWIVRLEWNWFDPKINAWVIPSSTSGLKRKKDDDTNDHIIPNTPEIELLMKKIREITGDKKHVFHSPEGKQFPHLHDETPNRHLKNLGWSGKQTAHGWRDVITEGCLENKFNWDIISRCLAQLEHKQGTRGHYDDSELLDQRRELMEWWTAELVKKGLVI